MECALSFNQRAMWHVHRLSPDSSVYHVTVRTTVLNGLTKDALRAAVQALVDRHPAARTTYAVRGEEPVQVVHDRLPANFLILDDCSEQTVERIANQPFDLARDSTLRVAVFGGDVVLFVFHHIAWDFESILLAMRELGEHYRAHTGGSPAVLADRTADYTDYVRWEQEWIAGEDAGEALAHWQRQLDVSPEATELPTDHERGPERSYAGAMHRVELGEDVVAPVERLARELGVTRYAVLLTIFNVLVGRFCGQRHVTLGAAGSQRLLTDFRRTIGNFVNPFVLHTDLPPRESFRALVSRTGAAVFRSLRHRLLPFPLVVERLRPDYDPSRSPLFDVLFVYDRPHGRQEDGLAAFVSGGGTADLGGLVLRSEPVPCRDTMYDLTVYLFDSTDTMSLRWEYHTELFEPDTIARIAEHFVGLLRQAVAAPDTAVAELDGMPDAERRLLDTWSATGTPAPELAAYLDRTGRPRAEVRAQVLDERLAPVPVGVTGELYLATAGAATPVGTGVAARWTADGVLHHLGEVDQYATIGGYRVELARVRRLLEADPLVERAEVVVRYTSGPQLVGYVVPAAGAEPTVPDLRARLRTRCPKYLVPAGLVVLDALPLEPAGGVALASLPEPPASAWAGPDAYVAPDTPLEQELAELWSELLEVPRVGRNDNFFDIGGHSLLAARIAARVSRRFGVNLPARDIFTAPTLEGFALTVLDRVLTEELGDEAAGYLDAMEAEG